MIGTAVSVDGAVGCAGGSPASCGPDPGCAAGLYRQDPRGFAEGLPAPQAGLKLAVASSSTHEWVSGRLARLGLLDSFDTVCARDDVQRTKPDPELYRLALERLCAQPHEAFAIEDSAHGVAAAKAAGLRCVAVPNSLTAHTLLDHADLRLGSLADLSLAELVSALSR